MKEYLETPQARGEHQDHQGAGRHPQARRGLRIGATVTFDELATQRRCPRAVIRCWRRPRAAFRSPQIRNMGTVGGDLCQRPRCWYYRNGFGLLARIRTASRWSPTAKTSITPSSAGGPAYFVSASSLGPALVALGAKIRLVSASGSRDVEAAKFFVTPQKADAREIALLPNEIVTEILVPAADTHSATYEVRQKEALDWPLATASVVLNMAGDTVTSARIVLGHVAPTPWVAAEAQRSMAGKSVSRGRRRRSRQSRGGRRHAAQPESL